jgi:hypothetical protein
MKSPKATGWSIVAVAVVLLVLYVELGALGLLLLAAGLVLAASGLRFAWWAFVPRSELPRNRVRHQRIRLYLRLHPGRGHATVFELHRKWGRLAAYKRSARVQARQS